MPPRQSSRPAHLRRFFFVPPHISRYEKFFCVVKNHAAWHNPDDCGMGKSISYPEIKNSSN
ncbi:hypothetical protein C5615_09050 [Burkholderia cepacia]|uniref:Uncharacterized protein n=1 Tax=Burkholderia cepacia TaxID=292 RepID=A0A2S8IY29_BURCE|nr:hypothetical protein C5615_09050 [Burkholderia cepacia]